MALTWYLISLGTDGPAMTGETFDAAAVDVPAYVAGIKLARGGQWVAQCTSLPTRRFVYDNSSTASLAAEFTDSDAPSAQSGTFAGVGAGAAIVLHNDFNVSLWGTFVASIVVERSFDGGAAYIPLVSEASGAAAVLSAPCTLVASEPVAEVLIRLRCTARTSGTVSWRISQ
jgi:hypothetical protein